MEYYVTRTNETNEDELYHYGVKGMKWGVRRKYPTVAQAHRIARKAGNEARKESIAKSRATDGGVGSLRRANRAANKARKEATINSLKEQKREIKEQKAAVKEEKKANKKPMSTAKKVAIGAAATAAIVGGAYGAYKVSNIMKEKASSHAYKFGQEMARSYAETSARFFSKGDQSNGSYAQRMAWDTGVKSVNDSKKLKKSTIEAAKYLYKNRKYL